MTTPWTLYTAPLDDVTPELLGAFLAQQQDDRLALESSTLELKRERRGANVARAIAGLANTGGGIVLLGVDEEHPLLEDSPGVPPDELVAVLSQCQTLLSPPLTPDIVPVRVPGRDTVVLVIRVGADPAVQPVVMGGCVFVRAPGQTSPASRDQIIDLVQRRAGSRAGSGGHHLGSMYMPRQGGEDARVWDGDLALRFASAVYLRPGISRPVLLGSAQRQAVDAAVGSSALAELVQMALTPASVRRQRVIPLTEVERRVSIYRAVAEIRDGAAVHRLATQVRVNGNQISYAVDVQVRVNTGGRGEGPGPRVGRDELVLALLCGLQTVAESIGPTVVEFAGGAPLAVDEIHCWVESPRARGLGAALDRAGLGGLAESPVQQETWYFATPHLETVDELAEALRHPLESLFVELGFDEEQSAVARELEGALARRRRT